MYQLKSVFENAMVVQILFVNYYLGNSIPVKMVVMTLSAVEKERFEELFGLIRPHYFLFPEYREISHL